MGACSLGLHFPRGPATVIELQWRPKCPLSPVTCCGLVVHWQLLLGCSAMRGDSRTRWVPWSWWPWENRCKRRVLIFPDRFLIPWRWRDRLRTRIGDCKASGRWSLRSNFEDHPMPECCASVLAVCLRGSFGHGEEYQSSPWPRSVRSVMLTSCTVMY